MFKISITHLRVFKENISFTVFVRLLYDSKTYLKKILKRPSLIWLKLRGLWCKLIISDPPPYLFVPPPFFWFLFYLENGLHYRMPKNSPFFNFIFVNKFCDNFFYAKGRLACWPMFYKNLKFTYLKIPLYSKNNYFSAYFWRTFTTFL